MHRQSTLLSTGLALSILTGCRAPRGTPAPIILLDERTSAVDQRPEVVVDPPPTPESGCRPGSSVTLDAELESGEESVVDIRCAEGSASVTRVWQPAEAEGFQDSTAIASEGLGDLLASADEVQWTTWEDCEDLETWPHLQLSIDDGEQARSLRCGGMPPADWRRVIDALLELAGDSERHLYYADVDPPPRVKEKVYPFESAKILFVYTGREEGTVTVWIDDYGDTIVMIRDYPRGNRANRTTIWKDGWTTSWSSDDNLVRRHELRIWNTRLQLVEKRVSENLERGGYVRKDNETVAGKDCEVWQSEGGITLWRWNDIDLKYVSTRHGEIVQSIVAKKVVLDVAVPDRVFEPPKGYEEYDYLEGFEEY